MGTGSSSPTVFHFRDGSIDDETTIFSQKKVFRLSATGISRKAHRFRTPATRTIDIHSQQVTIRDLSKGDEAPRMSVWIFRLTWRTGSFSF